MHKIKNEQKEENLLPMPMDLRKSLVSHQEWRKVEGKTKTKERKKSVHFIIFYHIDTYIGKILSTKLHLGKAERWSKTKGELTVIF